MTDSEDWRAQRHLAALGRRVRSVRRYRDITQEQLAKQVGTSRARVSDVERGRLNITLDTLFKLSRALDIDPWALFNDRIDVGQAPGYELPSADK
jgi:transcriptional regulator with XRE-family HTH domain